MTSALTHFSSDSQRPGQGLSQAAGTELTRARKSCGQGGEAGGFSLTSHSPPGLQQVRGADPLPGSPLGKDLGPAALRLYIRVPSKPSGPESHTLHPEAPSTRPSSPAASQDPAWPRVATKGPTLTLVEANLVPKDHHAFCQQLVLKVNTEGLSPPLWMPWGVLASRAPESPSTSEQPRLKGGGDSLRSHSPPAAGPEHQFIQEGN